MATPGADWLPAGVTVAADWSGVDWEKVGCVLAGSPGRLSEVCARLGFKNRCEKGRVFITAAKVRRLRAAAQKAVA